VLTVRVGLRLWLGGAETDAAKYSAWVGVYYLAFDSVLCSNNLGTSATLTDVCALLSVILVYFIIGATTWHGDADLHNPSYTAR